MSIMDMFARSSFGMGLNNLKDEIEAYALDMYDTLGLQVPADIEFVRMPHRKGGESGVSFDTDGKPIEHIIGINNVYLDEAVNSSERDDAYVKTVVNVGHELAHALQFEQKDSDMALCRVADMGNPTMYMRNYKYNVREIDAEIQGLRFAEGFISSRVSEEQAERLLLRYVHTRIADGVYHIDAPDENGFTSMKDVFSAFDAAWDAALDHASTYDAKAPQGCTDAYSVLTGFGFGKTRRREWDFMSDALEQAHDAHESNLILASAAAYQDPRIIREAGGVELPDLSIQAVFGREPPSDPNIEPEESKSEPKSYARSPKMQLLMDVSKQGGRERDGPEANHGPEK